MYYNKYLKYKSKYLKMRAETKTSIDILHSLKCAT